MPPERAQVGGGGFQSDTRKEGSGVERVGRKGGQAITVTVHYPSQRGVDWSTKRARFGSEPGGFLNRRSDACRDARSGRVGAAGSTGGGMRGTRRKREDGREE